MRSLKSSFYKLLELTFNFTKNVMKQMQESGSKPQGFIVFFLIYNNKAPP
jgi:hypothetical protein